jgi:hypothetical protein
LAGGIAVLVRGETAPIITMVGLFVATVGTVAIATGAAFLVAETWDAYSTVRKQAGDIRRVWTQVTTSPRIRGVKLVNTSALTTSAFALVSIDENQNF